MKLLAPLILLLAQPVVAATIAVIDSGMDPQHEMIVPNLWTNEKPQFSGRYKNVQHGWNFVNNNNQVIDTSFLPLFADEKLRKFYEIQGKSFLFSTTPEEREWAREQLKDPLFKKLANSFGTFIHGTHVAGISVAGSENKAMGITLLRTSLSADFKNTPKSEPTDIWPAVEAFIEQAAVRQVQGMKEIALFIHNHGADIANCSFGTGKSQAMNYADVVFDLLFKRKPTTEEKNRTAKLFLDAIVKHGKSYVVLAPKTLFVFAAGNDSLNNDEVGFSPANIKADNTISVAATYKDEFFAPFSNWGTGTVDLAAPGLYIRSAIPGGGTLPVSGTSQAAPFVSNIAGQMKDANPALTPAQIKEILMATVDKKEFLKIRVKSGGMVNGLRAIAAAEHSNLLSIKESIEMAQVQVSDAVYPKSKLIPDLANISVLPMPSEWE
jgi:cell wall-associated protease